MKWINLALLSVLLIVSSHVHGQETEPTEATGTEPEMLKIEFKPRVGLGVGMFTFYGDVASNHQGYHPTVSKLGYDLSITNPLTDYLDIKFYAMMGTVSANERSLTRNLNFQSDITTGGFVINYNFSHMLKPDRAIDPFIGVGLESMEFLSKTDLYDANGNFYHYWSDGSIRDLPENDPMAGTANHIYRDYTYETDLRELNLDTLGKYPERTLAIPVQIGATMNLGDRVKFRIGTSMHFTMTDLIDNVTGDSPGNRAGTKGNDKFLYTSFALTYDLKLDKTKKAPEDGIIDWGPEDCIKDTLDEDMDGVADLCDFCQKTPKDVEVDSAGCPLDLDNDLVPDYMDLEKDSPEGAIVNNAGVALTDEDYQLAYDKYMDTTGKYDNENLPVETVGLISSGNGTTGSGNGGGFEQYKDQVYRVLLGQDEMEISANEISKAVGNKHYKMIIHGDTTFFVVGEYDTPEEAQELYNLLKSRGIDPSGIVETKKDGEGGVSITPVDSVDITTVAKYPEGIIYRVQIGAFRTRLGKNVFADIPNLVEVPGSDGLVRYFSGEFATPDEAASHKVNMVEKGYEGAFIRVYKDGKEIKKSEGGFEITDPKDDIIRPDVPDPDAINRELIKFRVQVGAYAEDIPTDVLDLFLQIGNVIPKKDAEAGLIKYFIGIFDSYDEAVEFKKQVVREGLVDSFVVGDFNGRIITAQEAISLKDQ